MSVHGRAAGERRAAGSTSPIHSFSSGAVDHLLEGLDGMGIDLDALCRDAGIARRRDPGSRIERSSLLRLFALAEAGSGDPLIGLHLGERIRFGGLASFLLGSQNTVADALRIQEQVQVLLLGATAVSVERRGSLTAVILDAGSPPGEVRHLTEYCIASSCRLLRWLTVHGPRPEEIRFRHQRAGDAGEYARVFGCPVRFNTRENGALLSPATLAELLISAAEDLAAQLERAARAQIGATAPAPFRDAVVRALRTAGLDRAGRRRAVVARGLGVSGRTLQRRLEGEGTSFGEVLDETRRNVALELIADRRLSIAEVGSGVGYADQFAFNKAFRRWTGRPPSAYRREILAQTAGSDPSGGGGAESS